MYKRRALPFILLLCTATPVLAQEQPDPRTLIQQETLNALAQHISGAQALHNVMEMCPVPSGTVHRRNTPAPIARLPTPRRRRRSTGFSDVHIERFPLGVRQWDGEMAELWVTEPGPPQMITSYRDIAATLATGSRSADVTAELMWSGAVTRPTTTRTRTSRGRSSSAPARSARRTTWPSASSAPRASSVSSTERASPSIAPTRSAGAASAVAPRSTRPQRRRGDSSCRCAWASIFSAGSKATRVKVHAIVKATEYDAPMNVVVATIPGDGS